MVTHKEEGDNTMSFSENLQNLRKRDNLTQDDLADKLEVTRQAVSKWESGGGYPEMDKIVQICELFGCDMDTLVKGEIPAEKTDDASGIKPVYEKLYNSVSLAFSLAVGLILLCLTALILIAGSAEGTPQEDTFAILGAAILIAGIAAATPVFIVYGIRIADFRRKHPSLPNFYGDEEISAYYVRFGVGIGAGVMLIILGVVAALVETALISEINGAFVAATIVGTTVIAVPLFIFFGIRMGKYSMTSYKKDNTIDRSDKASSIIMLSATAIFLLLGFLLDAWKIAWIVFPVGGILCAIVSILFKSKNN